MSSIENDALGRVEACIQIRKEDRTAVDKLKKENAAMHTKLQAA